MNFLRLIYAKREFSGILAKIYAKIHKKCLKQGVSTSEVFEMRKCFCGA